MSVDISYYFIYGVKIDPKEVSKRYEEFEEIYFNCDSTKQMQIIYDGMDGNYAVAGRILVYKLEHEMYGVHNCNAIFSKLSDKEKEETKNKIKEVFPDNNDELELMFIAHYH